MYRVASMQQRSAPSAAPAPAPTEVVRRPEPGIARGVWEAPAWSFWAIAAAAVVATAVYGAWRKGWLRRRRSAKALR